MKIPNARCNVDDSKYRKIFAVGPTNYSHFATFHSKTLLFSIKSNSLKALGTYTEFNIAIVETFIQEKEKTKKFAGSEPLLYVVYKGVEK